MPEDTPGFRDRCRATASFNFHGMVQMEGIEPTRIVR